MLLKFLPQLLVDLQNQDVTCIRWRNESADGPDLIEVDIRPYTMFVARRLGRCIVSDNFCDTEDGKKAMTAWVQQFTATYGFKNISKDRERYSVAFRKEKRVFFHEQVNREATAESVSDIRKKMLKEKRQELPSAVESQEKKKQRTAL